MKKDLTLKSLPEETFEDYHKRIKRYFPMFSDQYIISLWNKSAIDRMGEIEK